MQIMKTIIYIYSIFLYFYFSAKHLLVHIISDYDCMTRLLDDCSVTELSCVVTDLSAGLFALPIYYICKRRRKRSQGSGRWLCWFSFGHPAQELDTQTHTPKIALGAKWPNTGHLDTTITTCSFPVRCISWISSIAHWPPPPHDVFGIVIKDYLRRFCFRMFYL